MARFKRGIVATAVACMTGSLVLPVAVAPSLLLVAGPSGCAGSDCDADTQTFPPCGGEPIDVNTWESGPVNGTPYLDFHGERTWVFDPSGWMGTREPVTFSAFLSLDPQPYADAGGGFAEAAGNLAEFTTMQVGNAWKVQVLNDSCAQYYLRVVLTYADTGGPTSVGTCVASSGTKDAGDP